MIPTTDTAVLTRLINNPDLEPSSFLLDMFFPAFQTEPGVEEIHFDIDKTRPRIAPFVHPTVSGHVIDEAGYETKSFKPAYVKPKMAIRPSDLLKRLKGEPLLGNLSLAERRDRKIAAAVQQMRVELVRREEVMAAEALRLGQVTVVGEKYPSVTVNFGRDAALTVTLAGLDLWSDLANATPLDDLEDWASLIQDKSGTVARTAVMDLAAWQKFRKFQDVKDILETRRGSVSRAELGPLALGPGALAARHVGVFADMDVWVYNDNYIDDADVSQKILPANTVLVVAAGAEGTGANGLEGVRAYGAILDPKANFEAERFFAKSWAEEDPAIEWVLGQSAPLVVPYRPNAMLAATVA